MTGYLTVKNWEKFQHYRDRNPPWIRLHREVLFNYDFRRLQDASKAHLMGIWLLASQSENRIPADPEHIGQLIGATEPVNVQTLVDQGFLELDGDTSAVLAGCKQSAKPEAEAEAEVQRQKQIGVSLVRLPKKGEEGIPSDRALAIIAEFSSLEDGRARAHALENVQILAVHQYWAHICAVSPKRQMCTADKVNFIRARLRQSQNGGCGGISTLLYAVDGAKLEPRLNHKDGKTYHDVDNIFRNWTMVQRCAEHMTGYQEGREHKMVTEHPEIRGESAEAT